MHFALLRELAETSGEFFHYAVFPGTKAQQIDFWCGEVDAPVFCLLRFFKQLGYVKQGFRRNTAAVEADAAGVQLGIDQCDRHAEIGSEERSGISTGTAADDCDVQRLSVRHVYEKVSRFQSFKLKAGVVGRIETLRP